MITIADKDTAVEAAPAVKTVKVEGLGEVPARFGSQETLEEYASSLTDEQFVTFANLLRSRKWTKEELKSRIQPLRKSVDILTPKATSDED